ncbi:hypothetical protein Tco_1255696 [Tanacetum coccineum]
MSSRKALGHRGSWKKSHIYQAIGACFNPLLNSFPLATRRIGIACLARYEATSKCRTVLQASNWCKVHPCIAFESMRKSNHLASLIYSLVQSILTVSWRSTLSGLWQAVILFETGCIDCNCFSQNANGSFRRAESIRSSNLTRVRLPSFENAVLVQVLLDSTGQTNNLSLKIALIHVSKVSCEHSVVLLLGRKKKSQCVSIEYLRCPNHAAELVKALSHEKQIGVNELFLEEILCRDRNPRLHVVKSFSLRSFSKQVDFPEATLKSAITELDQPRKARPRLCNESCVSSLFAGEEKSVCKDSRSIIWDLVPNTGFLMISSVFLECASNSYALILLQSVVLASQAGVLSLMSGTNRNSGQSLAFISTVSHSVCIPDFRQFPSPLQTGIVFDFPQMRYMTDCRVYLGVPNSLAFPESILVELLKKLKLSLSLKCDSICEYLPGSKLGGRSFEQCLYDIVVHFKYLLRCTVTWSLDMMNEWSMIKTDKKLWMFDTEKPHRTT